MELNSQLEADLKELTEYASFLARCTVSREKSLTVDSTMTQILSFAQEIVARATYKKYLYKSQDASNLASLETQLMHSFQVFEVSFP